MAETVVKGYMLNLKWGDKLIKGLITTGLKLKENFEEVLLKVSEGVPVDEFIDYDGEFTAIGQTIERDPATEGSSHEDYETLREAASAGAAMAFVYGRFDDGEKIVTGYAKITDYSEDANSKDRGAYNITFKTVKGSIIFSTFSTYPEVIDDGNTVAWYIASELSTITKDGGNIVSRWNDYLGSGHDLVTGSALWVSPDYIQLDGISQYLKCAGFTLIQPEFIYMVVKAITWTNLDYIFDGNATNAGRVRQDTVTPRVIMSAGTDLGSCDDLVLNTWAIMRCRFNGANSKIQINESTAITGDCGIYNMSGFTLGSRGTVDARFSNIQVREIILRKIADDTEDEIAIYNYLKTKYSL